MKKLIAVVLSVVLIATLGGVALAQGPVEPSEVNIVLPDDSTANITKIVTTPTIPPNPDIYFLSDTTGSMGSVIGAVSDNASAILAAIVAVQPTAQFGVGYYRDYPGTDPCFVHQQSITSDTAAVEAAINTWSSGGGGDGPEGQFYALNRLAADDDPGNGTIGWRSGPNKIVVWFGDAPAHDPVPPAATGLGDNITEASVTADLVAAGITVIAISTNSTGYYEDGTDDDPTDGGGDYTANYSITEDGSAGQATRIATTTGGGYYFAPTAEEAADAVIAAIEALTTDVWGVVTECDSGLNVDISHEVLDVVGGSTANFTELIWMDPGVAENTTLFATVTFYANSYPITTDAEIGKQTISVTKRYLDIKPGSYPNSINTKNDKKGVIPVALLGTDTFDVTTANVTTLEFAGASPAHDLTDPLTYADHLQDVNYDGYTDLVSHYITKDTTITKGDTSACLTYQVNGSVVDVIVCDSIRAHK